MEPGESKNTNSESKPAEKDKEKKRNPEACKWNPGAISSAIPDLGAGSSTAEGAKAPRMVLSKERTSREGFSQLGPKKKVQVKEEHLKQLLMAQEPLERVLLD